MESIKEVKEMEIDVRGDIIGNDDKWIYDWLEWDSTCPNDIKNALQTMPTGDKLIVNVNSGGGSVMAGQEIYSLLHGRQDVEIHIQSLAGSAASVIAMANTCKMSPVATIMILEPVTDKKKPEKNNTRTDSKKKKKTHVVKGKDTLQSIAKKYYGSGSYADKIYKANKTAIEKAAKKHGLKSSSKGGVKGWWLFDGTKLVIP